MIATLALVALMAAPDADGPPSWIDLPITAAAATGWYVLFRNHDDAADPHCPCDRADAPKWDRVGIDGTWKTGERLADYTLGGALALAAAGAIFSVDPTQGGYSDAVITTEAVMLTGLLTQATKTAVSRPYPYMLREDVDPMREADGVNYAAFWSGHTAVPMAAAVAAAYQYQRRRPDGPLRWVLWIGGPALALGSGVLQISAGNHYPSDVLTGAVVGAGVGLAVPWLRGTF